MSTPFQPLSNDWIVVAVGVAGSGLTVARMFQRVSRQWNVSKSEALRRVRAAAVTAATLGGSA